MTLSSNLGPDLARVQLEIAYGEECGEGWIGDVTLDVEPTLREHEGHTGY